MSIQEDQGVSSIVEIGFNGTTVGLRIVSGSILKAGVAPIELSVLIFRGERAHIGSSRTVEAVTVEKNKTTISVGRGGVGILTDVNEVLRGNISTKKNYI